MRGARWPLLQFVVMTSATSAFAEPRIEAGGFVGTTVSKTGATFHCSQPISSDVCISSSDTDYSKYGVTVGAVLRYPIVCSP